MFYSLSASDLTPLAEERQAARFRDLENELYEFEHFDAEMADYKPLRGNHNWANRIDSRLDEIDGIIEDCRRFLARSNIDLIPTHKLDLYAMPQPRRG